MVVDATEASAVERVRPDERSLATTLRALIIWAGILTLAAISVLAIYHLVADVVAVLGVRGGRMALAIRFAPIVILSLAGLLLALLVAWLAGRDRRRELVAIAITAGVLVGVRVFMASQFDSGRFGEPAVYRDMAESFVALDPEIMGRPMGYAAALAGAFAFIGDRQLAIEAVNLLLALLCGGVVLALARGLYGPRAAALAFLGYAVWPAGALMTVVSIPHIAFDLAVVSAAWAAVAMPPGWRGGAVIGALLGISQYLRPTAPFLLPAFILARLWPGGTGRTLLAAAIVPVLVFLLVLTPVVLYNLDRTGSPSISTSDYGGQTFYIGTDVSSGGRFSREANLALAEQAGTDQHARSALGARIAIGRIRDDPLGIAALAIRKQDILWGTEHYGVQYAIKQKLVDRPRAPAVTAPMLLSQGFYALLLVTATVGVVLRRREADALIPLAVTVIWTISALHALLEVRDRHHAYAIPLLLPLAALAMVAFLDWAQQGLQRLRDR